MSESVIKAEYLIASNHDKSKGVMIINKTATKRPRYISYSFDNSLGESGNSVIFITGSSYLAYTYSKKYISKHNLEFAYDKHMIDNLISEEARDIENSITNILDTFNIKDIRKKFYPRVIEFSAELKDISLNSVSNTIQNLGYKYKCTEKKDNYIIETLVNDHFKAKIKDYNNNIVSLKIMYVYFKSKGAVNNHG